MLELLRRWYRSRLEGPWVRPWGLAAPILVLIVSLPLLRPLFHPTETSENERQRLSTIQAIVERHTFNLAVQGPSHFSSQPPVLAALLAGPYWVMYHLGLGLDTNPVLAPYILTLLGSALPVAAAGGMVYRMGRLFELRRPWRMVLAISTVFGSGLIAYATVLNSNAPGASLILAACGCFFHACTARSRGTSIAWFGFGGFAAALASSIDLGAVAFLWLLPIVILSIRWPAATKLAGVSAFLLGAVGPVVLHGVLTVPQTGDLRPGFLHGHILPGNAGSDDDDDDTPSALSISLMRLVDGILGPHGLLSHFPVVLFGVAGLGTVLHRHWPGYTKALAVVCILGALTVVGAYIILNCNWNQPMVSVRWYIVFTPALLFWGGAWLRKEHHPAMWSVAGTLLGLSALVSIIGAAAPFPPTVKPGEYTLVSAIRYLTKGAPPALPASRPARTRP